MRTPKVLSLFLEWRWAPCVGLVGAALGYVLLALLLVPAQLGGSAAVEPNPSALLARLGTSESAAPTNMSNAFTSPVRPRERHLRSAQPAVPALESAPIRRGFSPPLPRPEPEAQPMPPPPMPDMAPPPVPMPPPMAVPPPMEAPPPTHLPPPDMAQGAPPPLPPGQMDPAENPMPPPVEAQPPPP